MNYCINKFYLVKYIFKLKIYQIIQLKKDHIMIELFIIVRITSLNKVFYIPIISLYP